MPTFRVSRRCRKLKYLKRLPSVSAVIAFRDEHFSVLTRTVHLIVNRSPRELLREVLLVNDASEGEQLTKKLRDYINLNFDSRRVRLIDLKTKLGPIGAQVAGARRAKGEVLVRKFSLVTSSRVGENFCLARSCFSTRSWKSTRTFCRLCWVNFFLTETSKHSRKLTVGNFHFQSRSRLSQKL